MKPPRLVNNFFIDRLEVHINIIKYVTPIKIKFISYRNSTKYTNTNNINRNIQYIHSDTLDGRQCRNFFDNLIWDTFL